MVLFQEEKVAGRTKRANSKIYMEERRVKNNLKLGGLILPNIKTQSKAIKLRQCGVGVRREKETNGRE